MPHISDIELTRLKQAVEELTTLNRSKLTTLNRVKLTTLK